METKQYFGCKVNQRADSDLSFAVFLANSKEVCRWAGIKRVGEVEQGTQRLLKKTRVRAIKRFFQASAANTIPVSVIIAFNPGTIEFHSISDRISQCIPELDVRNDVHNHIDWGTINFEFDPESAPENRPALIVDGQHRINGMASFEDEDLPVVVAAFISASTLEQAFQFVVINNKAQKVPTDNVKAILSDIDEEELQQRLLKAGVNYGKYPATLGDIDGREDSPFYHMLAWQLNPTENKIIQLTAIESCLKYLKTSLPILEEDDDSLKTIFITTWRTVSEVYPALWAQNATFMSKVNIVALNEFISDKIENSYSDGVLDIFDPENVGGYVRHALEAIPAEFWTSDWIHPLQDNAIVRNRIKDDLRKIIQNIRAGRDWKDSLQLVGEV